MKSFIVEFWSSVFSILRWISPFQLVRQLFPFGKEPDSFVEAWVVGNSVLAAASFLLSSTPEVCWWETVVMAYGGLRILEVVVYQVNVLLFDEYRARRAGRVYFVRGFRRLVILTLHNYLEVMLWFALGYRNLPLGFGAASGTVGWLFASLNLSFVTMTSFGYSSLSPTGPLGQLLTLIQAGIGLFMALLIVSRFLSLIPSPGTAERSESLDPCA